MNYEVSERKELIDALSTKLMKEFNEIKKKVYDMIKAKFEDNYSR